MRRWHFLFSIIYCHQCNITYKFPLTAWMFAAQLSSERNLCGNAQIIVSLISFQLYFVSHFSYHHNQPLTSQLNAAVRMACLMQRIHSLQFTVVTAAKHSQISNAYRISIYSYIWFCVCGIRVKPKPIEMFQYLMPFNWIFTYILALNALCTIRLRRSLSVRACKTAARAINKIGSISAATIKQTTNLLLWIWVCVCDQTRQTPFDQR